MTAAAKYDLVPGSKLVAPGATVRKHVLVGGVVTGCWSTGTIVAVHPDRTVDISYASGDTEVKVELDPSMVAPGPEPPPKSAQKRPITAVSRVPTADDFAQEPHVPDKHLRRMQRNRESAQQSRERKKAYVESLETKVAALTSSLRELERENTALRALVEEAGLDMPPSDVETDSVDGHDTQYAPPTYVDDPD